MSAHSTPVPDCTINQKIRLIINHAVPIITNPINAFFNIVHHLLNHSSESREVSIINHPYKTISNAINHNRPRVRFTKDFTTLSINHSSLSTVTHHIAKSFLATIVSSSESESFIPKPKFFSVAKEQAHITVPNRPTTIDTPIL